MATNAVRIVHLYGHFIKCYCSFGRSKNGLLSVRRHPALIEAMPYALNDPPGVVSSAACRRKSEKQLATLLIVTVVAWISVFESQPSICDGVRRIVDPT